MTTFEASRLSEGNKIMPNKISIDDFGVTLKIPGAFSGKEKTLSFTEISSVKIDSPMIGFSTITFNTLGWDDLIAKGFSKDDAQQIKELVQQGISGVKHGRYGLQNNSGNSTISQNAGSKEINEHDVEIARLKMEQELEENKLRAIKEREEEELRLKKGQALRDKGRPFAAWLTELNPVYSSGLALLIGCGFFFFGEVITIISILITLTIIIILIQEAKNISWKLIFISIAVVVGSLVLLGIINNQLEKRELDAAELKRNQEHLLNQQRLFSIDSAGAQINLKLEAIEDQIKLSIQQGEKEEALNLVNQLIHPMHEIWNNQENYNPYYDEWWTKKRNFYREQIFAIPINNDTAKAVIDSTAIIVDSSSLLIE